VADHRSQEKTGLYISTDLSCRKADQRLKIGGLTVLVAAALIVGLQGADLIQLKSCEVIPEMNQKDEPITGY
jgi:hypothetical protein